jgi:hypothetical protein
MKIILKPEVPEQAQFECDVSGVPLKEGPIVALMIDCGYGYGCTSGYGGHKFELHLSADAADIVLSLLRELLLNGGPLGPHCVESDFLCFLPKEKPIGPRKRAALLRKLETMCRRRLAKAQETPKASAEAKLINERKAGKTAPRGARKDSEFLQ